jgi:hypothetical protein
MIGADFIVSGFFWLRVFLDYHIKIKHKGLKGQHKGSQRIYLTISFTKI